MPSATKATPPSLAISEASSFIAKHYDNRNAGARGDITITGRDVTRSSWQNWPVDTHDELLAELKLWIGEKKITQAAIARMLDIPPPRVTEMIQGSRMIQQREMPVLAALFWPDRGRLPPAEIALPILRGILLGINRDAPIDDQANAVWDNFLFGLQNVQASPQLRQQPDLLASISQTAAARHQ